MSMIELSRLTEADAEAIRSWPPYPESLRELDYALREGGWLDHFPESPRTLRFAARNEGRLVGFSILTDITEDEAEFYIALHPHEIGRGIGRPITERTLEIGFTELGLQRIYLKVRDWHRRGFALYKSVGFQETGASVVEIHGKSAKVVNMSISAPASTRDRDTKSGFSGLYQRSDDSNK